MKRKTVVVCTLVAGGVAAAGEWLAVGMETPASPAPAATAHAAIPFSIDEKSWASLPRRETMGEAAGELFARRSWAPPRPKRPVPVAAPPAPPEEPAPPAMPYRIAGKLVQEDRRQIVLAKGDAIFIVREGDTLEESYRVAAIDGDRVTLLYLPLGMEETLQASSAPVAEKKFETTGLARAEAAR